MYSDHTKFVKYNDLKWSGVLKAIRKSTNILQPLFEAFTNSLESIRLRQQRGDNFDAFIKVFMDFSPDIEGDGCYFHGFTIADNGIGFDNENYKRLITFKDDTKGFNNRGSGRIQMIHSFQRVVYQSTYYEGGDKYQRSFTLSKAKQFIDNNTIIYNNDGPRKVEGDCDIETILTMSDPLLPKDSKDFLKLGSDNIKRELLNHYILALCSIKEELPRISIFYRIAGDVADSDTIEKTDIPDPTQRDITISVPLYRISDDMKRVEAITDSNVSINVLPYKISSDHLLCSEIKVTSKGEISDNTKIRLTCIDPNAELDGYRYLFLLSSEYFDNLDSDERGNIEIIDKTEFKKRAKAQGYLEEQIVLNDVQESVNSKACEIYAEISHKNEEFKQVIEQLKKDYLLSEEALSEISSSDSIDEVFKKAYNYDAKIMAQQSATYEKSIQNLNKLDPSSDDYNSSLADIVDQLVESIPLVNKTSLSKYVVRRKMVIELMEKILKRMTEAQESAKRNEDEKLLHNLIFKQHMEDPLDSDLWLINEEYMYFNGSSETQLSKVTLNGEKVFKEEFSAEEKRYLRSLGKNREKMRTDILLFPSEGKCVIIEFKNPDVNVSDCLNQINKYAYFLRNFTKPEFKFLTFYGYLIGENIENRDVRSCDGDFKTAPNLDFIFRPNKTIPDESGTNQDGSLYMEVLKYSVLKARAEIRNKMFIRKLMGGDIIKEDN